MCNCLPLFLSGTARSWFFNQKKGSIYSWDQLREEFSANFQGSYKRPMLPNQLFTVKQQKGESTREFLKRFSKVRSQVADAPDSTVINACKEGLLLGELNRALGRDPPRTTHELFEVVEKYARGEEDDLAKKGLRPQDESISPGRRSKGSSGKRGKDRRDQSGGRRDSKVLVMTDAPPQERGGNSTRGPKKESGPKAHWKGRPGEGRNEKRGDPNQGDGRWCAYHKMRGHDTNECRQYAAEIAKILKRGPEPRHRSPPRPTAAEAMPL
ncbi:MAG: retrotransposon gag family protein [Gammaproteobacteria bacterium]